MKRSLLTVCLLGLSAGANAFGPQTSGAAGNALEQLGSASGNNKTGTVPPPVSRERGTDSTNLLLQDAYGVDLSGNSDGGASRGALVLKRINAPSGYTMTGGNVPHGYPIPQGARSLTKTATLGSADFSDQSGLLVKLTYRPDGEDYSSAAGKLLFKRTATPSQDFFTDADGRPLFTKTAVDGETTVFTCADGTACLVMKLRPWGDEFFADGKRILLRAACPGGDVFYAEDNTRRLIRVSEPGGAAYFRPAGAPGLPDIVQILKLQGNPAIWRAVLFEHKRGFTHRRIIWPIPSLLY